MRTVRPLTLMAPCSTMRARQRDRVSLAVPSSPASRALLMSY